MIHICLFGQTQSAESVMNPIITIQNTGYQCNIRGNNVKFKKKSVLLIYKCVLTFVYRSLKTNIL